MEGSLLGSWHVGNLAEHGRADLSVACISPFAISAHSYDSSEELCLLCIGVSLTLNNVNAIVLYFNILIDDTMNVLHIGAEILSEVALVVAFFVKRFIRCCRCVVV